MAQVTDYGPVVTRTDTEVRTWSNDATYQAYQLLHIAFIVAPIIAGIDKFIDFLVNWDQYLSPAYASVLPVTPHEFMYIVGAIEVIAGLIVAFRPRIGAYIVTLWLWGIIANLCLIPGYFDIALRDFGLSLAALALGRLSARFDRPYAHV